MVRDCTTLPFFDLYCFTDCVQYADAMESEYSSKIFHLSLQRFVLSNWGQKYPGNDKILVKSGCMLEVLYCRWIRYENWCKRSCLRRFSLKATKKHCLWKISNWHWQTLIRCITLLCVWPYQRLCVSIMVCSSYNMYDLSYFIHKSGCMKCITKLKWFAW